MIQLQVTDAKTDEVVEIAVSMHDAYGLYKALREIVGDIQYETQPGQLITVPKVSIPINMG